MPRLSQASTFALLVYAAHTANAQRILGAGVSGGGKNSRVEVTYVRETRTVADSVHLAAVVYWRGAPDWRYQHGRAEAARAAAISDSVARASRASGTVAGGTVTAVARAWIEYDWHTRKVAVLGVRLTLPAGDSALVILADRVDSVGGPPTLRAFAIRVPAQFENRRHLSVEAEREEFVSIVRSWCRLAEADPRVQAFIGSVSVP